MPMNASPASSPASSAASHAADPATDRGTDDGTRIGGPPIPIPDADEATVHTLLNCLLREVSGPEHQATVTDGHLLIRLPRADALLRIEVRRTSLTGAHRFRGPASRHTAHGWSPLDWPDLAELVAHELELRGGIGNDEFAGQVRTGRDTVDALLASQPHRDPASRYLDSEQSLVFGHRFHPAPKAHSGTQAERLRYAPETGRPITLHHLAVRDDLVRESESEPGALAATVDQIADVPEGFRLLPVHPWQMTLLSGNPVLRAAIADGRVLDLGPGADEFAPTASVRTLAGDGFFLKFSLDVRITNCVRKNAAYELDGAVALTRILAGPASATAARHPGFGLLPEPAYRTVDLGDPGLYEGLGVIVRDAAALDAGPGTPLLAAAVADEYALSEAHVSRLVSVPPGGSGTAVADAVTAWFGAYVRLLVPPVLTMFFEHGVVLEPHLQNVLVCVDEDGLPVRMLFRDLEGTKLIARHHREALAALPGPVASAMTYDAERGWNRVVYCLLVNHVGETAAALADLCPSAEPRLWAQVRAVLREHAEAYGCPPPLRALLAGVPLPAKANLLTRWQRAADRDAGYVPLPSPLGAAFLHGAEGAEPWIGR